MHPCDKRRATSHYRGHFPEVDFSLVGSETDALWQPHVRETKEELRARAVRFLHAVMARPEKHIAVVSHSGFLQYLLAPFAQGGWPGPAPGPWALVLQGRLGRAGLPRASAPGAARLRGPRSPPARCARPPPLSRPCPWRPPQATRRPARPCW